jgi:hypothetical protein
LIKLEKNGKFVEFVRLVAQDWELNVTSRAAPEDPEFSQVIAKFHDDRSITLTYIDCVIDGHALRYWEGNIRIIPRPDGYYAKGSYKMYVNGLHQSPFNKGAFEKPEGIMQVIWNALKVIDPDYF